MVEPDSSSRLALPLRAAFGQARDFRSAVPQAAGFGVTHHRHHQANVTLRGDADMHRAEAGDDLGFVVVTGVDLREVAQGNDQGTHEERQQGQLAAAGTVFFIQMRAQLFHGGDVDFFDVAEVRGALGGVLHALGDLAAHADHRDLFFIVTLGVSGWLPRRSVRLTLRQIGVEVFVQHATGRAGAAYQAQLNAQIQRMFAHGRGGQWTFIGFTGNHRALANGSRRGCGGGDRFAFDPASTFGAIGASLTGARCGGLFKLPAPSTSMLISTLPTAMTSPG